MHGTRRSFGRTIALGSLAGAAPAVLDRGNGLAESKPNPSKLKLAVGYSTDEMRIAIAKSFGIQHVTAFTDLTDDNLRALTSQSARHGMTVSYASRNSDWGSIVLNLPGREKAIDEFNRQTIALGKAGIRNRQTYFYATGVLLTHLAETSGGLLTRAFSTNRPPDPKLSYQRAAEWPLARKYSAEEIWDNYTYFVRKAAPVAEDANVRISIHPEDPPGLEYFNEPRVIASSFEGYKRALEIANSPNIGMCLCSGCVLEAGERWGKDIVETIKYFGARNKIFKVHLRNVSSPLPEFHETWLDDGYYDMYKIIKALREVNNDCIISMDHWPGSRQKEYGLTGWVRCATYAKALLDRANKEAG